VHGFDCFFFTSETTRESIQEGALNVCCNKLQPYTNVLQLLQCVAIVATCCSLLQSVVGGRRVLQCLFIFDI